jgi:hypothetical protein
MTQPFSMCASCFRSPMQDLPAHPTFLCINHILFVILRNLSPSLYSLLLCYNHCLQNFTRLTYRASVLLSVTETSAIRIVLGDSRPLRKSLLDGLSNVSSNKLGGRILAHPLHS